MRNFINVISLLLISFGVNAQRESLSVTRYLSINGFTSCKLLLCSDSSFFMAFSNCTESEIVKGKWEKINRKLKLIANDSVNCQVVCKYDNRNERSDSTITFLIKDYLDQPMEKYSIFFYDKNMEGYKVTSDSNGIIKVERNKFLYYVSHDEFGLPIDHGGKLHSLTSSDSFLTLSLNYPDEILRERLNYMISSYLGGKFIVTSYGLKSTESKLKLKKLQTSFSAAYAQ